MANASTQHDPFPPSPGTLSAPSSGRREPPLLSLDGLTLEFAHHDGSFRVLEEVSLALGEGETLCLVGESGSGKSITALSVARLLPSPPARYTSGRILLQGADVLRMGRKHLRRVRGGVVSYVFQEPAASLNPVMRVGNQIKETLRRHRPEVASDEEVKRLLEQVGIPAPAWRMRDYPHQLSGGMQQRVMIAMALASRPKLLIADEPTTALDVTIQAQIIELLAQLKTQLRMSILLITHNLGIVGDLADRVAVMYAGQIVELAPAVELLTRPFHPYTRALMDSVPVLGSQRNRLTAIPGTVPNPGAYPAGCRFHPRCPLARPDCARDAPSLVEVEPQRWVRCPYWNHS